MKNIHGLLVTILLIASFSAAQEFRFEKGETAENFASRVGPKESELFDKVIVTVWNARPAIIAFYRQSYKPPADADPSQQDNNRIIGFVYVQNKENSYNGYLADTIDTEGGDPKIECVTFANADKDAEKELVVIASWEQNHATVHGTLYGTYIYDDLSSQESKSKLHFMKDISKKLDGGCDCTWEDGSTNVVKYKTAAAIKEELKRMGFR